MTKPDVGPGGNTRNPIARPAPRRTPGRVIAWGGNDGRQAAAPDGLDRVVAIAAGGRFSLALRDDGTVTAWGYNRLGPPSQAGHPR